MKATAGTFSPTCPIFRRPTLIHYDRHLRYDYDTGYPDHLPPNKEKFGSAEEYTDFLKAARRMGHLTMPYSNSTFWGENPRGETFLREGDVGLRRDRSGKISLEAYGHSDNPKTGYTASLWHPVTQKANRYTIHQFTKEFPADILFQDQFGARALVYDFNKAVPAPNAYFASFIAQTAEDSKSIPLATEGGFAHLLDYEVMLVRPGRSALCRPTAAVPPTQTTVSFIRRKAGPSFRWCNIWRTTR